MKLNDTAASHWDRWLPAGEFVFWFSETRRLEASAPTK